MTPEKEKRMIERIHDKINQLRKEPNSPTEDSLIDIIEHLLFLLEAEKTND